MSLIFFKQLFWTFFIGILDYIFCKFQNWVLILSWSFIFLCYILLFVIYWYSECFYFFFLTLLFNNFIIALWNRFRKLNWRLDTIFSLINSAIWFDFKLLRKLLPLFLFLDEIIFCLTIFYMIFCCSFIEFSQTSRTLNIWNDFRSCL